MGFKRTYTLVDIAEKLGRARTTLADWARQFREFLPTVGSGRTMRYTEEAVEVFGLISKMKDANEPPEYIREQLRSVVREIVVTMTDNDDGKPYLMQLTGEMEELKRAVVMLAERLESMTTENDEARREIAATTERLTGRIDDVSNDLRNEIRNNQEQTSAQLEQISATLSRVETHGQRRGLFGRLFGKRI